MSKTDCRYHRGTEPAASEVSTCNSRTAGRRPTRDADDDACRPRDRTKDILPVSVSTEIEMNCFDWAGDFAFSRTQIST